MLAASLLFASGYAGRLAPTANSTRFLVLGDWGGVDDAVPTTPTCAADGAGMAKAAAGLGGVGFVLAVGDNFYDRGIKGDAHSPRFKQTFEDVYQQPELQVPCREATQTEP